MNPTEPQDHLEVLDRDECILRLVAHAVGRIAVTIGDRNVIYPVNYAVHEDAIVFRTRQAGGLAASSVNALVAFEIDGVDFVYHEGWSVLVTGRSSHVTDPNELDLLGRIPLAPWAGEHRDCFVRIPIDDISGRRIHHRAT